MANNSFTNEEKQQESIYSTTGETIGIFASKWCILPMTKGVNNSVYHRSRLRMLRDTSGLFQI